MRKIERIITDSLINYVVVVPQEIDFYSRKQSVIMKCDLQLFAVIV
jgi:hypothetical protein